MNRNPEAKMTHSPETYLSIATDNNPDLSDTTTSDAYIDGFTAAILFIGKYDHPILAAKTRRKRVAIIKKAIADLPMFVHTKYYDYFFPSSSTNTIQDESILLEAFINGYRIAFHHAKVYSLALFTQKTDATVKAIKAELYGGKEQPAILTPSEPATPDFPEQKSLDDSEQETSDSPE